uniref:Uncharacterized protein n=1 Tax=Roseihalotalea indica TaxID=2867963 RepID=A0AA49PZG8_9BACT|nr:hypothetical protein K4G66_13680 [Tunicatimonas sp. TK19036]
MNLEELKPGWNRYSSSIAATEERTISELDALLPSENPPVAFFRPFFLLKNAAMCALIIVSCGGC